MIRSPRALAACAALLALATSAPRAAAQPAPEPQPSEAAPVIQPAAPAQADTAPAPLPPEVPPPPVLPPEPPAPQAVGPLVAPQPPLFAPRDFAARPKVDLLMPFAATSLALGGALVLGGGIQLAAATSDEYCGLTGCTERPHMLPGNIAGNLIGAGTGLAVVGAVGLLEWGVDAPKGDEHRRNTPMMLSGFSATALSAASLGLAIGNGLTYSSDGVDFETGWPFFISSTVLAGVGIPLWVVGSRKSTPAQDEAERASEIAEVDENGKPKIRSRGMMIAGAVLTAIGGATMIAGAGVVAWDLSQGGGIVTALIGLPMIGGGAIFPSIGIPLLVVGTRPKRASVQAEAALPEVSAGPTSIEATWRFE